MRIGIMQGRLMPENPNIYQSFPSESWREELRCAKELGFDSVEWLFDRPEKNPLLELGGEKVGAKVAVSGLFMDSLCLHYTAACDVIRKTSAAHSGFESLLKEIIDHGSRAGIRRFVFPLMEASSIKTEEDREAVKNILAAASPLLKRSGSILCLETGENADKNIELLRFLDLSSVMLHYDIGNAAACGLNVSLELDKLGRVLSGVHVKDKNAKGQNVRLGTGLVCWEKVFATLEKNTGIQNLILETTMGKDPVSFAAEQLQYVRSFTG